MTGGPSTCAGIYVHVPFCLTRCGYCDFNAYAGLGHLATRYAEALKREAELAAPAWSTHRIGSVFFGGGTPTTLGPEALAALLAHLRRVFDVAPDAEITTEANPDTVDERVLEGLLGAGFTRLSMGVQSFDPAVLAALERVHGPQSARRAYAAARAAGFANVNLDLIYGAHGETLGSWRRTLDEAVAMRPEHLSCYALTIEPATPLGWKVKAGTVPPPDADLQAEMYDAACEALNTTGYRHYEVSNWARPGFECRHNLGYWQGRPYLGLGAGAHSYREGRRWWNLRPPAGYIGAVERGEHPVGGDEVLTPEEVRLEATFLRLRTTEGLPAGEVAPAAAAPFLEEGLLTRRNGHLVLTDRGMFLANDVALALADTPAQQPERGALAESF
ncbi:MAG: radical SAM family heme chaperone HemW [Actinomycetota bacterium]|nr:radical SAM family heme chaperone HemW [Actinomycetota bacterium]